jgi:hypothetical protein
MNVTGGSLKEIERRAYRSTFSDGIYDIQFGVIFLIFALMAVFEVSGISRYLGYALLLVALVLPWLGKRYITIPRMGQVEFGRKRKKRKLVIWTIAAVVAVLILPLVIMVIKQNQSSVLGWKLIAMIVAPLFVLAVYTTDFPRLYLYAALLFFGVVLAELLRSLVGIPLNAVIGLGVPGVGITGVGIGLLVKFIRTHPRTEIEYAGRN